MIKRTFTIIAEKDPESGWLVGEVPELPGCYSQAPDMPTLRANMKEAIILYIETAGLRPDDPRPDHAAALQIEVSA